jgi:hypothetical protein
LNGENTNESNENEANNVAPCSITFKKLYVNMTTAPSSGRSRAFTFQKNGASQSTTVTISDTATTGNDTTNNSTAAIGDAIGYISVPTSTPTASVPNQISIVGIAS